MTTETSGPRAVSAPRGTELSCRGWGQEAALRMLMNNLDPEVAERPDELVVYGGTGRAARSWEAYDAIVRTLRTLADDETLLVQSGKPVGVFRTHEMAPRVLISNSMLVPKWADWDTFRELEHAGLTMYGQMTAGSWIYIGTQGILQGTYETLAECAHQHFGDTLAGTITLTGGLGGMGGAQPLAVTMNGGVAICVECDPSRIARRIEYGYLDVAADDVTDALRRAEAARDAGAALSGDPEDIAVTDRAILDLFPGNEALARWIRLAEQKVHFQGLPARICWLGYGERHLAGLAFNDLVARGEVRAPIVLGRDHLDCGSVASPYRETEGMADGSDAIADWPILNALVNTASGASWVSVHHGGGVGIGRSIHAGQVCVADGTPLAGAKLERVLTNDPGMGVIRHVDAGYDEAAEVAADRGVRIPMDEHPGQAS